MKETPELFELLDEVYEDRVIFMTPLREKFDNIGNFLTLDLPRNIGLKLSDLREIKEERARRVDFADGEVDSDTEQDVIAITTVDDKYYLFDAFELRLALKKIIKQQNKGDENDD